MPELPEVETIKLGLLPKLAGQTISSVKAIWPKSLQGPANKIVGSKITGIERSGKVLIISLDNDYSLLIHLKMTGQLVLVEEHGKRYGGGHPTRSMVAKLPDNSTRVIFIFKSGYHLFFNDQRKFGWIKLVESSKAKSEKLLATMGPEPLLSTFILADFKTRVQRRRAPIKAVLLDQSTLAGLGNIYVDEALHLAKIHPLRKGSSLNKQEIERLYYSIIQILKLGVEHGGTSFINYVNAEGVSGDYLKYARAFRRTGQPCPVCGTPIAKIRVAGRGTHLCPRCQRPPRPISKS